MKESMFQSGLIKKIKENLPGAIVLKNDPGYIQGVPDLIVLNGDKWATLECKRGAAASKRPNQDYYVVKMNEMSFSRFVRPDNEEAVLSELVDFLG